MKKCTLLFLTFLCAISIQAQNTEEAFSKKGKYLIETGYNLVGGFIGSSGTGLSSLTNEQGESITGIGFNAGKFITENVALKLKLGLLSGQDTDLRNLGIAAKYYIVGRIPVELSYTRLSQGEGSNGDDVVELNIGYAFYLADNIYLEPSIGGITTGNEALTSLKINFAMML